MPIIGTLPNTLTNGTTADATQVMADLNQIVNDVNANAAPVTNTALLNAANTFTQEQYGVNAVTQAGFPTVAQVQGGRLMTLSSTAGRVSACGA
jgi:protein-disulfide isomerase-like protein with CxxC motif